MATYRIERVGNLIQEKLGALIVAGKIKDPRVDPFLSITRVRVSRDLSTADVYVSSYKSEGGLAKGVAGLQSAAGFIQGVLAGEIRVFKTPKLRFHADSGVREGFEIIQKIETLEREAAASGAAGDASAAGNGAE
ncbi:MAG: 30S ribosome-binding factor RbfA [Spirochaetaceae bacterium]|jgi:ribosome-binding factor A|nr:30S ribosome-binding factor RbfA [Spirochaetaceae bacterium]